MGGGIAGSEQGSQQSSSSAQNVWNIQAPYLQQLYGQGAMMGGAPGPTVNPGAYDAWQSALTGGINPATGDVINQATQQMGLDFSRNVLPGIRRDAVAAGAGGGTRQGIAEGLAAGEAARAMASTRTNLTAAALDQANQARTAALGLSPAMMQSAALLPWTNVEEFAKVLGSPTVLGTSQGSGSSQGYSFAAQGGAGGGKGGGK